MDQGPVARHRPGQREDHNRQLCKLIEMGKAKPSFIVSHECSLEAAPDSYEHFDARDEGWTTCTA